MAKSAGGKLPAPLYPQYTRSCRPSADRDAPEQLEKYHYMFILIHRLRLLSLIAKFLAVLLCQYHFDDLLYASDKLAVIVLLCKISVDLQKHLIMYSANYI